MAPTLSHRREDGQLSGMPSSSSSDLIHAIYEVAAANALYLSLVDDWATTFYLQVRHEIKLEPRKIK